MILPPLKDLSAQSKMQRKLEEMMSQCVRCGTCLTTCPTFQIEQTEGYSPRGRISLVRALKDEEGLASPELKEKLVGCLECRACETACPNNVSYHRIIEYGKSEIDAKLAPSRAAKFFKWLFLQHVFRSDVKMALMMRLLRIYKKSGIQWLARKTGILKLLPGNFSNLEKLMPTKLAKNKPVKRSRDYSLIPEGKVKGKVYFFSGCIADHWMQPENHATLRLLLRAGYQIEIPSNQKCCGALHVHQSAEELAKDLAEKNIEAFGASDDYIVVNSAGCGAQLKEYAEQYRDERFTKFSNRVMDLSQVLWNVSSLLPEPQPIEAIVTYDDPCHLVHAQGISKEPRELIKNIPGVRYVELKEAAMCCGSAGVFNIVRYDLSMEILERKVKHISKSGAEYLLTANPGCLFQLRAGVESAGLDIQVMHLAEFLDQQYKEEPALSQKSDKVPW